jgi:hypothetical protein
VGDGIHGLQIGIRTSFGDPESGLLRRDS